jgi:hypothetical protein
MPFPGCSNHFLDNEADHLLAWHHGGTTGISNLGQPCPRHHMLKHASGWRPTPATKNEPPGWISRSGRKYKSEHQDWEPPRWPRLLAPQARERRLPGPTRLCPPPRAGQWTLFRGSPAHIIICVRGCRRLVLEREEAEAADQDPTKARAAAWWKRIGGGSTQTEHGQLDRNAVSLNGTGLANIAGLSRQPCRRSFGVWRGSTTKAAAQKSQSSSSVLTALPIT